MPFPTGGTSWGKTFLALGILLLAFGIRFHIPLSGSGVFCARDLHFFFIPQREAIFQTLQAGEFPWLFPGNFGGLPLAANPNAALFWPGTWLYPFAGISGIILTHLLVAVLSAWWAMRWCGFSRAASTIAALCLLGSGVFQSITCFMNATGLLAILPLCLAAGVRLGMAETVPESKRWMVVTALLLAFVILAGEPAMGFLGILTMAALVLAAGRSDRWRRLGWFGVALLFGVGLALVQILPATEQLRRSARGIGMPLESATGACSVHPARLLTVVLPRSGGDPNSPNPHESWLPGGLSYFDDVRPGLMPLLLAFAGAGTPTGLNLLVGAVFTAVLSCGTHLPGFEWVVTTLPGLTMLRYPEKWWLITTLLIVAAAGMGVQRLRSGAGRTTLPLAAVLLGLCGAGARWVGNTPDRAIPLLETLGLCAGTPAPEAVSQAFGTDALVLLGTAALVGLVAWLRSRDRISPNLLIVLLLLGCGTEMATRLPDTIPWGSPELLRQVTPEIKRVQSALAGGFFYDEGDTLTGVLQRRAVEHEGIDPLRTLTGTIFGVSYLANNEIDRMAPMPLVRFWSAMAATPWGGAKRAALADFGASIVRLPPEVMGKEDFRGSDTLALPGKTADRLVQLSGSRPRFSLEFGTSMQAIVPIASSPSSLVFRVKIASHGADLVILAPKDPFWKAEIDDNGTLLYCRFPEWDWGLKVQIPGGNHQVVLRYENPWFALGAALSLLSLGALFLFWRDSGFRRRNR